jgi:transcriptional regulator with GAF, ATPase, and Fis domain
MNPQSLIQNFINKASISTINTIVWILGILIIIAIAIILFLLIRNLSSTFIKQEKYLALLESTNSLKKESESNYRNYEKVASIMLCFEQLNFMVNSLIDDFIFKRKSYDEINSDAHEIIKSIVFIIPQNYKTNFGDYHRCFIWIINDDDNNLLANVYSSTGQLLDDLHIQNSFAGRIYSTEEYRYTPNVEKEKDFEKRATSSNKYKSLIGVPIKIDNSTLGVLTIDARKENAFLEDIDIPSLDLFAMKIALCLSIMANIADASHLPNNVDKL